MATASDLDLQGLQGSVDGLLKDMSTVQVAIDKPIDLMKIPQGPSSRLDSDTVDGLQTSPANNPSPNTLIPLGPNGKFPSSVIPTPPATTTGMIFLETQSPSGSSSFTFSTTLVADTHYKVIFRVSKSTSGDLQIRFNGDSGSNYKYVVTGLNESASSVSAASGSANLIKLNGSQTINSGDFAIGDFEFSSMPGSSSSIYGFGRVSYQDGNPFFITQFSGFRYSNTAISSLTVFPSAGTITGKFLLYKIV